MIKTINLGKVVWHQKQYNNKNAKTKKRTEIIHYNYNYYSFYHFKIEAKPFTKVLNNKMKQMMIHTIKIK